MQKSPTYCVLPHLALSVQNYGDVCACNINKQSYDINGSRYTVDQSPLHNAWHSPTRQEIMSALDRGDRHPSCQVCWDDEAAGKQSTRQQFNRNFEHLVPFEDQPRVMIIKPGNTCNAACRMCNPATSSSWYQDDFKRKKIRHPELEFKVYIKDFETVRHSFHPDNPNFWPTMLEWNPGLEFLDIYGGEPWLIDGLWRYLEQTVESGHSEHINININTNASIWRQEYLDILQKCRSVLVKLSFDSHDPAQFEYIRHRLKFDECLANSQQFINWGRANKHVKISVVCSPSNLNVGNLDEIYNRLVELLPVPVSISNFITGPDEYYDMRHLPRNIKKNLIGKFRAIPELHVVANFLSQTIPGCSLWWPKFCMETDRLDTIRGQSFRKSMPAWFAELEPYWQYDQHHPEWF
jgi:MoaA/NifB/PqqE/SkfB family radical SAM enzyme